MMFVGEQAGFGERQVDHQGHHQAQRHHAATPQGTNQSITSTVLFHNITKFVLELESVADLALQGQSSADPVSYFCI